MTSKNLENKVPKLGNLSIAILEHICEPVIGEKAIDIVREPYEEQKLRKMIAQALQHAEERFIAGCTDTNIKEALLSLAINDVPSIASAVRRFYDRPIDSAFNRVLREQLNAILPKSLRAGIEEAVKLYLSLITEELSYLDEADKFRDKLNTRRLQEISSNSDKMSRTSDSNIYDGVLDIPAYSQPEIWVQHLKIKDDASGIETILTSLLSNSETKKVVLAGKSGSGKTTTMKLAAFELNQTNKNSCVYIPLRAYAIGLTQN